MKRVLLSLLVIGGVFYPAYLYFAGNGANLGGGEPKITAQDASSEQANPPDMAAVEEAEAAEKPEKSDAADAMRPAVPNSRHAITVEQAPSPAPEAAEAPSQTPPETPPQAPAPQSSPPAAGSTQQSSPPNAEASSEAKPNQPEFVKVTSPASVRKGPSGSSAIIGIAHSGAEAQVVSRDSDWVQIIDPDSKKTGWIHQSFLVPQTEPSSRPASQQEIDAALAAPAPDESKTASADSGPSAKSRSHKHGSSHKRHRRAFAWGFIFRRAW
jgi:SH3-like domain-containing protein